MNVPSIKHSDTSNAPRVRKSSAKASRTFRRCAILNPCLEATMAGLAWRKSIGQVFPPCARSAVSTKCHSSLRGCLATVCRVHRCGVAVRVDALRSPPIVRQLILLLAPCKNANTGIYETASSIIYIRLWVTRRRVSLKKSGSEISIRLSLPPLD